MRCPDCHRTDERLFYRSRAKRCVDCTRYSNMRWRPYGPDCAITRAEFIEWRTDEANQRCAYCEISSDDLYALDVTNIRTGKRHETVGHCRVDPSLPYTLENIRPCCALCNGIKSNVLSHEEMTLLSDTLAGIWRRRLGSTRRLELA